MDEMSKRSSSASGATLVKVARRLSTYTYRKYEEILNDITESQTLYILFVGTASQNSGYSWCPICTEVSNILRYFVYSMNKSVLVFIENLFTLSNIFRFHKL